jgi:hypothetical protein
MGREEHETSLLKIEVTESMSAEEHETSLLKIEVTESMSVCCSNWWTYGTATSDILHVSRRI